MALSETIVWESRATRRLRWLAPLALLLGLALAIMAPGLLIEWRGEPNAPPAMGRTQTGLADGGPS